MLRTGGESVSHLIVMSSYWGLISSSHHHNTTQTERGASRHNLEESVLVAPLFRTIVLMVNCWHIRNQLILSISSIYNAMILIAFIFLSYSAGLTLAAAGVLPRGLELGQKGSYRGELLTRGIQKCVQVFQGIIPFHFHFGPYFFFRINIRQCICHHYHQRKDCDPYVCSPHLQGR